MDASTQKANRFPAGTLARATASSKNAKIGDAATTLVEQRSCPTDCPFFNGGGCYAESGRLGSFVTRPLNQAAAARNATPEDIARAEAAAIDDLKVVAGRPLRLHTVGDCKTDEAARIVAAAAARYVKRGGGPAWTYTHAWRMVERASWGDVHVLASCETAVDVGAARARGYATALVVETFPSERRFQSDGETVVPCPAQTRKGVTCASCRACMDSERLRRKAISIGFEAHGDANGVRLARLALRDPDNPRRKLSSRILIPQITAEFIETTGKPPTNRQLAEAIGISTSSVAEMRRRLADEAGRAAPAQPTGLRAPRRRKRPSTTNRMRTGTSLPRQKTVESGNDARQ